MPVELEPRALRIAISLARFSVENDTSPSSPRQATKMAKTEKARKIILVLFSGRCAEDRHPQWRHAGKQAGSLECLMVALYTWVFKRACSPCGWSCLTCAGFHAYAMHALPGNTTLLCSLKRKFRQIFLETCRLRTQTNKHDSQCKANSRLPRISRLTGGRISVAILAAVGNSRAGHSLNPASS